jgi:hypothetical protein
MTFAFISKNIASFVETAKNLIGNFFLLKEDGFYLLLETGDKIILENSGSAYLFSSSKHSSTFSDQTKHIS